MGVGLSVSEVGAMPSLGSPHLFHASSILPTGREHTRHGDGLRRAQRFTQRPHP